MHLFFMKDTYMSKGVNIPGDGRYIESESCVHLFVIKEKVQVPLSACQF